MSKQHHETEPTADHQKTRERIIAAAAKVLAEKGYEATTLREISREAEAAPGLVHYYFGGKDQLLVEALQHAGLQFHRRMEQLIADVPTDHPLEMVLDQIRDRVRHDPDVYRLHYESFSLGLHNRLIEPRVRERLAERRQEIGSVMARVIEQLQRQAGSQNPAPHPATLAAVLLAAFDGLALQAIMDPAFDLAAPYALLAQMLHALLAQGTPAPHEPPASTPPG